MLKPQAKTVFLEKPLKLKLKFVAREGSTVETVQGFSSVAFEFPMTAHIGSVLEAGRGSAENTLKARQRTQSRLYQTGSTNCVEHNS